ncbi:hypothetical protein [Nocardia jiangxiensis]|uniref:restriction endonuclease subunit S n=1 Tax=Nocardia jiangxiensis TaxID=282685 RepID=UPI0012F66909|nr:hypothetical protein [Nocardia jiangxiensis]
MPDSHRIDRFSSIPLGNLLTHVEAGRSPLAEGQPAAPGEWGVLKVSAIRSEGFDSNENKAISDSSLIRPEFEVKPGDLIISRANTEELVGLSCIAREPRPMLMLSDKTLRLHINHNLALSEYVAIVLGAQSIRSKVRLEATGTSGSMKNLGQNQIRQLPIPHLSISQQRELVEAVTSFDREIEALNRRISKVAIMESSLANKAFAGPRDEFCYLGDVADVTAGVTLGSEAVGAASIELPYLRVANVLDGVIDTSDLKYVRILRAQLPRYSLMPGDVLLTEGGDIDKLGRGAVWDGRVEPCLHQNHIFRVRCSSQLVPEYLSLYTASAEGRKYFLRVGKQSTNLASINSTQVKAMPVPMPSVGEQQRLIGPILAGREFRMVLEARIAKLRTIRKALIEDLLTGKVAIDDL